MLLAALEVYDYLVFGNTLDARYDILLNSDLPLRAKQDNMGQEMLQSSVRPCVIRTLSFRHLNFKRQECLNLVRSHFNILLPLPRSVLLPLPRSNHSAATIETYRVPKLKLSPNTIAGATNLKKSYANSMLRCARRTAAVVAAATRRSDATLTRFAPIWRSPPGLRPNPWSAGDRSPWRAWQGSSSGSCTRRRLLS